MNKLIKDNQKEIIELCKLNHVKSLFLFGSINEPDKFRADSDIDIDILVSFKMNELSLEDYADSYFNLIFGLENLLGRKIDITTDRSVSNPFFEEELDKTKVLFFDSLAQAS